MGEPIGNDAWQKLLDDLREQHRRRAVAEPDQPLRLPNPGATEQQLRAAEDRLGFRLDPQYRELLSIADGWDRYNFSDDLLGTGDLGIGPRWDEAVESLHWFVDDIGPVTAHNLQIPDDYATTYLPIADRLCLLLRDTPQGPAGAVFSLFIDYGGIWPDLYSYLVADLRQIITSTDYAVLGPHSDTWGRDIRIHPPTTAEIVSKIIDFANIAFPDYPSQPEPGAAPAALGSLANDLGNALHPEHRELLAVTDGLTIPFPMLGRVLSVAEIRDGTLWNDALTRAQQIEDDYHGPTPDHLRTAIPRPRSVKPPVRERILQIPVVPFSVHDGIVYGVDVRDGKVRELLDDAFYSGSCPGYANSYGTVRNHLLAACDLLRGHAIMANRHNSGPNDDRYPPEWA